MAVFRFFLFIHVQGVQPMKPCKFILAAICALTAAASAHAESGSVPYVCQGGKKISVSYVFNDETGFPVKAEFAVKGQRQTLAYDDAKSDHVDSFFVSAKGWRLTAPALTIKEYKKTDGIMITSPQDEILFKECAPAQKKKGRKQ
jgi:potential adhesin complex protein